jgi:O-antigen/teichoic acid export membrane protein
LSNIDQHPAPPAGSGSDLIGVVRRGTRIVLLAQVASQLVSLAVLAWMLRLVDPADYGLLGMALPAVLLPRMAATLGLSTTILQRELSHAELSGLFWLNVICGMLAASATALAGVWLADAYKEPLLLPLCLSLAGTTLIVAVSNQHQALLERNFTLGPLAVVRLFALACGGFAGVYSAYRGAGLWALVAQQYGELIVLAMWVWMLEPWRPDWPRQGQSVSDHLRFSGYYSASQLAYYVAQNLDKLLLPMFFGGAAKEAVGLYSQAFNLMTKPMFVLTAPLTGLIVSGLSQTEPSSEMRTTLVARFFRLAAVGLFPCAAGLTAVAPDVMLVMGGADWRAAGWILSALAPALFIHGLANLGMHVFAAAGRSGRLLGATLVLLVLLAGGGAAGMYLGRMYFVQQTGDPPTAAALGLAASYSLVLAGLWFPVYVWFCMRTAGIRLRAVLAPLLPALAAALLMGLGVWLLCQIPQVRSLSPHIRLALLVTSGVAFYVVLAMRELRWFWHEIAVDSTRKVVGVRRGEEDQAAEHPGT